MTENFIRIDDVCKMLGFKKQYVYQLVFERKIPFYKPTARTLFFEEGEIKNWIKASRYNAENEQ